MLYAHTPHFPLGPRSTRPLLITRGIFGLLGVCGLYFSLRYLPLSEATVLGFLAPVLSCYVCSWLMEGEVFGRGQQIAALVSLVGVVAIARPETLFSSSSSSSSDPVSGGNRNATSALYNGTGAASAALVTTATAMVTDGPLSSAALQTPAEPTPHQHLYAIALSLLGGTLSLSISLSHTHLSPYSPFHSLSLFPHISLQLPPSFPRLLSPLPSLSPQTPPISSPILTSPPF